MRSPPPFSGKPLGPYPLCTTRLPACLDTRLKYYQGLTPNSLDPCTGFGVVAMLGDRGVHMKASNLENRC